MNHDRVLSRVIRNLFVGVNMAPPIESDDFNSDRTLDIGGKHIAFFGKLGAMSRKQASQVVRDRGATVVGPEDRRLDFLIVGADEPRATIDRLIQENASRCSPGESAPSIVLESEWWASLGLAESDPSIRSLHTPAMLADLLSVPVSTVRQWHRRGLIESDRLVHGLPYFEFQEVAVARKLAELTAAGISAGTIEKHLRTLSKQSPGIERPLAELKVLVDGPHLLLRQEGILEQFDGQRRIDFASLDESSAGVQPEQTASIPIESSLANLESLQTPDEYMELANDLEDDQQIEAAIEVYRAMQLAFGPSAEINFRLGEMLYMTGQIQAARERYYAAIEIDESYVEARASLGCVLVELGQIELAIAAFEGVLDYHEPYPDVHFHLAAALEATGRTVQADLHWQRFIDLAPESPWAPEALRHLQRH